MKHMNLVTILVASIALVLVCTGFSCGGSNTKTELSPELTEAATVFDLIYTPANHGSGVSPTFDFDGNVGLEFTSIDVKQKYVVIFECQHGKFIIEENQDNAERLWKKLKKNQAVTIKYKEIYEVTYEEGKPPRRVLKDFDFLDAY